jgi:hypothetical protein
LKGIPLELVRHKIELDITIPLAHHAKYRLIQIPNYVVTVKHDIVSNKFYTTCGRGYMVVINYGSAKEEWEVQNLCRFLKGECNNEEGYFFITHHI